MTHTKQIQTGEHLLEVLAAHGEMKGQEFLKHVPRKRGDYLDFYPVASLLHAAYITTDSTTNTGRGHTIDGKLGENTHATAVLLCQLMLPPDDTITIDGVTRTSAHDFPISIFMTAEGYLRLDELEQRRADRKRKRIDYMVSLGVAVLVALLSSYLAHYFATKRLQFERAQPAAPLSTPAASPTLPH